MLHLIVNIWFFYFFLEDNILYYITASRDYTKKTFSSFLKTTKEKGFNVDAVYFNTNKWRIDV